MSNEIFFYGEDGKPIRINLDNVFFLKVVSGNVQFWEQTQIHTAPITLDEILSCLPKGRFIKIHSRYAVAAARVHKIEYDHVLLNTFPCYHLPLTQKYYVQLRERLNIIGKVGPGKSFTSVPAMVINRRYNQTG